MKFSGNSQFILVILVIFGISPLVFGQGVSSRLPQLTENGVNAGNTNSFLNPNRLQIQQGLTFATSFGNGSSVTAGIYTNRMSYRISDKLQVNAGFSVMSTNTGFSSAIAGNDKPDVSFDVELKYQPTDNMQFRLGVSRVSSDYLYYRYRMGGF